MLLKISTGMVFTQRIEQTLQLSCAAVFYRPVLVWGNSVFHNRSGIDYY